MKVRPRKPSHATIVAYLALLLALGGSSYAATHLGKNSVTAKALKNGAVKRKKLRNDAVDSSKVQAGGLLPSDIQGGVLPSGGFAAGTVGNVQPPGANGNFQAATSITTTETGRFLVFGSAETFLVCNASGSCAISLGLYVDGVPLPDSGTVVSAPATGTVSRGVTLMGITGSLPAGIHQVLLGGALSPPSNVSSQGVSQRHVSAIAVKP
jgi:hypothetical protein